MGLFVHAGHGLTYANVGPVAAIPEIEELNIGHSIVSRAVMVGMRAAVAGDAALGARREALIPCGPMTNPLGAADFFALEAGECLDRLETLVGRPTAPPADEFLRTARVLRGSALMAASSPSPGPPPGSRPWPAPIATTGGAGTPATREQVAQAVEEFRLLVRRVREWNDADTARERPARPRAWKRWPAAARTPAPAAEPTRGDLNTGVRAFVAREGALIASALDRAARALRAAPADREPLYNVIRRMQSLRGLAELGELAPAARDPRRHRARRRRPHPAVRAAARGGRGDGRRGPGPDPNLARRRRAGRPDPEAEEARRFTELLLRAFAVERDVVPIESLYFAEDPEPVTPPASQPQFTAPAALGPLELVSHGEHLCQSADLIAGARSRDRARSAALPPARGAALGRGARRRSRWPGRSAVFARSAREALAAGVATRAATPGELPARGRGAAARGGRADDRMLISRRLLDVGHRLDGLRWPRPRRRRRPRPPSPRAAEPEGRWSRSNRC